MEQELQSMLQDGDYAGAAGSMVSQIEDLLATDPQYVKELLARFPVNFSNKSADWQFMFAMILATENKNDQALGALEQARHIYQFEAKNSSMAVRCIIESAHLYYVKEEFHMAFYVLSELAKPLLDRPTGIEANVHALYLREMAQIYIDTGRLSSGGSLAQDALYRFRDIGNQLEDARTNLLLAIIDQQKGDYQSMGNRLQRARHLLYAAAPGTKWREIVQTFNLETHLHWYQGNLAQATEVAKRWIQESQRSRSGMQPVFAHTVMGNIHRALGAYRLAEDEYEIARTQATEKGYLLFTPWLGVQTGWLHLLEGDYSAARILIQKSLETKDKGQAISFGVFLSVLNMLERRFEVAKNQMIEAFMFYSESGDNIAVCGIRFNLAYAYLRLGSPELAAEMLRTGLAWLTEARVDYFPLWWHPEIMTELCCFAIEENIYPDLVERILNRHLLPQHSNRLRTLLSSDNVAVRVRVNHLLNSAEGNAFPELEEIKDPVIKKVLEDRLLDGRLRRDSFVKLRARLRTRNTRKSDSATIIAVFALYIEGVPTSAIHSHIERSSVTVSRYVNDIYTVFGLPKEGFTGTLARREALIALVRDEGYI